MIFFIDSAVSSAAAAPADDDGVVVVDDEQKKCRLSMNRTIKVENPIPIRSSLLRCSQSEYLRDCETIQQRQVNAEAHSHHHAILSRCRVYFFLFKFYCMTKCSSVPPTSSTSIAVDAHNSSSLSSSIEIDCCFTIIKPFHPVTRKM